MTRASGDQPPLGAADFAALFRPLATLPGPILAAVSGGPDSTALLHGLAGWSRAEPGRPPVVAATVDHGLRAAAREEAEAVGAAAAALGVPHHILTWTRPDGGAVSQARARAARYRLLGELAGSLGCAALATAHTLDDQAETVLLRMAAGSGLAGLGAMRPITGGGAVRLHRPLLAVPKARLVATCRAQGWFFATDPSNADPRHARPRWRALMPGLAAEGLDARRLARLAARLRRADDALDRLSTDALAAAGGALAPAVGRGTALDLRALAAHPQEIVLRALASALGPDAPIRLDRLEACADALVAACRAGRPLRRTLAGRLLALDGAGMLAIRPEPARSRGRRTAPVTLPAAGPPHSLGNEGPGT